MAVFEYIGGGGGSSDVVGYPAGTKMYVALLTQTGTDAPVATVLQNTLGGTVVWSRSGVGTYQGTLAGVFTLNKTVCTPKITYDPSSTYYVSFNPDSSTNVVELSTDGENDAAISNYPIQILVFP